MPCAQGSVPSPSQVSLADYRGHWLLLLFYPRDFSLVCPTELAALSDRMAELRQRGCEVLGISTDSLESHRRWLGIPRVHGGLEGLQFPLASDEQGLVSRAYGVYVEPQGVALRGVFIVDPNGVLQYQAVHNLAVGRRVDELLRILAALQSGGLCAEDWTPERHPPGRANLFGPGALVAQYRIEERIGEGGFATVYRAHDMALDRPVALKVMQPSDTLAPNVVFAEARAAAALSHANLCTVYGLEETKGVLIIAMEYVAGETLRRLLEKGALAPEVAARIGGQIASGMAAAHELGIVHGDLKPTNIMITEAGVVKILDFGLSRRYLDSTEEEVTLAPGVGALGQGAGTPSYMSPEQTRGEPATKGSDIFALGLLLYEMLTGRQAFEGKNILAVFARIRVVDPEPYASQVPQPFADILRGALKRDPLERRVAMGEIVRILAAR